MTQIRFIKWKDNLVSDDTNNSKSGIIPGARYRGFDGLLVPTANNLSITHTLTGEVRPDISENDSAPMGVWVSRQGVTIKEDTAIDIAIDTNAGNSSYRNDYLIGRHHHDVIYQGGVVATYNIIKGPINQDTLPDKSGISDNDWVILAVIRIKPNTAVNTINDLTITPQRPPSLGNTFPALLDQTNRFVTQNQEYQQLAPIQLATAAFEGILTNVKYWLIGLDGAQIFKVTGADNQFLDFLQNKPDGTEISLYFVNTTIIRPFVNQLKSDNTVYGSTLSLKPIVVSFDEATNFTVKANQIVTFKKFNKNDAYSVSNRVYSDFWKVVAVSDTPASIALLTSTVANLTDTVTTLNTALTNLTVAVDSLDCPGNIRSIKLYGPIATFFNTSTGRGLSNNIFPKHQICNGNLGTPDLRDAKLTGYSGALSSYSATGLGIEGNNFPQIQQENIPVYDILFNLWYYTTRHPGSGTIYQDITGVGDRNHRVPSGGDEIVQGAMESGGSGVGFDVRGKRYEILFIMRLPQDVIDANPI